MTPQRNALPSTPTFNCCPVYGASGAQSLKISTRQQAVHALIPLSLCPSKFGLASSFATVLKDSLSSSSCSIPLISFDKACSRRRRSAMGMDLPARHDKASLNCRRGIARLCPCSWVVSVTVEVVVLVAMISRPAEARFFRSSIGQH